MKKNLLLLLALSAGALTVWSQEPSYQSTVTSQQPAPQDMPMSLTMPETVYISGVECRLDKHIQPNNKLVEYIYEGNSILCNKYDFDWTTNNWRYAAKSNSEYNQDGKLILFESSYCPVGSDQWLGNYKCEYEYDLDGHTSLYSRYLWSESKNDWYCQAREESLFSDKGYKVYSAKWCGTETSPALKGNIKIEIDLYDNGSIKAKTNYLWDDQANNWVGNNKEYYEYNQRGNTSKLLVSQWNANTLSWEQSEGTQYEYGYDANGKKQTIKEYKWNMSEDQWDAKYLTTFGYDQRGRKIYRVRANALSEDPLMGFEKDVYEYNESNQVILHDAYVFSEQSQQLWLSYQDKYTYDDNRNVNTFTRYKWLEGNPESFGWQKWERDYTDDRKPAMRADYKWDSASKSWVGKSRKQLSKDDLGLNLNVSVNYDWTPEGWTQTSYSKVEFDSENLVATVTEYEANSDKVISQELFYYVPVSTTGITDIIEPANTTFSIEGKSVIASDNNMITIFSIDGKMVNSGSGKAEIPNSGFYIVKVGDNATKVYVK